LFGATFGKASRQQSPIDSFARQTKVKNNKSVKKLVTLFGIIICFATFGGAVAQQKPVSAKKSSSAPVAASRSPGTKPTSGSTKPAPGASEAQGSSNDLFGGDSKDRPTGPTEITATQETQFDTKTRIGAFIGNVKVVDPQFTMTSDRLKVHLNKDEDGGGLNDAEANGNVIIVHVNQPKTQVRQAQNPGATVLVQILLSVCFCRANDLPDFRPPRPWSTFPERWLLFRLVV
jgi:hypothetical protein